MNSFTGFFILILPAREAKVNSPLLSPKEEALGKKIDFWGEQYEIVGVTENFHQQSLREAYEPLIFRLIPDAHEYFL